MALHHQSNSTAIGPLEAKARLWRLAAEQIKKGQSGPFRLQKLLAPKGAAGVLTDSSSIPKAYSYS